MSTIHLHQSSQTVSQPTATRSSEWHGSVRMTHVDQVISMRRDVLDAVYKRTEEKVDQLLSVEVPLTYERIQETLGTLKEEILAMKERVAVALE